MAIQRPWGSPQEGFWRTIGDRKPWEKIPSDAMGRIVHGTFLARLLLSLASPTRAHLVVDMELRKVHNTPSVWLFVRRVRQVHTPHTGFGSK